MDTFATLITGIAILNACGLVIMLLAERRPGKNPVVSTAVVETETAARNRGSSGNQDHTVGDKLEVRF